MTSLINNALPSPAETDLTGLVDAIMQELAGLLDQLVTSGEGGAIDLRSLPMTAADRNALKSRLGTGEVEATLNVAGISRIQETGIFGIWWIRHEDADGRVVNEQIAVTQIPAILMAHSDDIAFAREQLTLIIETGSKLEIDPAVQGIAR